MAKTPARSQGELRQHESDSIVTRRLLLPAQDFIHRAGISGALLLAAAVVALIWANSPWQHSYHALWEWQVSVRLGNIELGKTLHHLINDGLMAVFFFVVGLEIKRELIRGDLSSVDRAMMPIIAAIGGMIVPAAIYGFINRGETTVRGWGIPMATDIAFALAVLAILGKRIPSELRLLLLGLAIVDDIGSILVIAFFYTETINLQALAAAVALLGALVLMRKLGARALASYIVAAFLLWLAVLQSGVHATLAGVVLGAMTPLRPGVEPAEFARQLTHLHQRYEAAIRINNEEDAAYTLGRLEELAKASEPPLERAERLLHPWVTGLVLPLFALANAGVEISWLTMREAAQSRVAVGIVLGLVVGKIVGIFSFTWIAQKTGIARLPGRVTWAQVFGMSAVAGIGFTVSLFIAALSFAERPTVAHAKAGVLVASLAAAVLGTLLLRFGSKKEMDERRAAVND